MICTKRLQKHAYATCTTRLPRGLHTFFKLPHFNACRNMRMQPARHTWRAGCIRYAVLFLNSELFFIVSSGNELFIACARYFEKNSLTFYCFRRSHDTYSSTKRRGFRPCESRLPLPLRLHTRAEFCEHARALPLR
jgi:hypothetical protein